MNNIELNGVEVLQKRLKSIGDLDKLEKALKKGCTIVEREAKKKAPKGTGELKRSITSTVERENGEIRGIVFTPLLYAPYVEFGTGKFAEGGNGRKDVPWNYQDDEGEWHTTSGMPPHPYMRPALDENRVKIVELLKEVITDD